MTIEDLINGPFPRPLVPLFQNETVQNLLYENEFDLHEIEPLSQTRFDTEAKGDSEMTY